MCVALVIIIIFLNNLKFPFIDQASILLNFYSSLCQQQGFNKLRRGQQNTWQDVEHSPPQKTPDCSTSTSRMVAANFLRYFDKGRTFGRRSAHFENNIKDCRERRTNRDASLMLHRRLAYCQHASLIDKIKRRAVALCWCRSLLLF